MEKHPPRIPAESEMFNPKNNLAGIVFLLCVYTLVSCQNWELTETSPRDKPPPYPVFLPLVASSSQPTSPTPLPTDIPQTYEPPSLSPTTIGLGIIFLVIFLIILSVWVEGRRDRFSGFSPEQQKALILQNKAQTLLVVVILMAVCLCSLISSLPYLGAAATSMGVLLLLFAGGVMAFIALSSIFSEASILRGRGQREFLKGDRAVWAGAWTLFILGLVLYAWLSTLGK